MGNLHLELVTPEKVMISQEADSVVAPGSMGEFGVLPGHVPFLSSLVPGELRYTHQGKTEAFVIMSGFAEISNDKVSILVDAAERGHEIDVERARSALKRASERLARERGAEDVDFLRAEAALKRAIARIKVAEKLI
jgi:F-type H+-transporting ATPase subunit epsilon